MDRYVCLKESGVVILDADDESSSDDDDDDEGDDENEDESEKEGPDDDRGQLNKIIEEHGGGEDAEVSDGGAHEQFEADNATESVLLREEQVSLLYYPHNHYDFHIGVVGIAFAGRSIHGSSQGSDALP